MRSWPGCHGRVPVCSSFVSDLREARMRGSDNFFSLGFLPSSLGTPSGSDLKQPLFGALSLVSRGPA